MARKKSVADAEADLRKAQEKAAQDATSNSDAVRKAEEALAAAQAEDKGAGPGRTWPPEGLEFKTPPAEEKK